MIIQPLLLASLSHGGLWFQLELGGAVVVPLLRTRGWDVAGNILLNFGAFEPLMRVTIPLRDAAEFGAPMHFETGLAYRF